MYVTDSLLNWDNNTSVKTSDGKIIISIPKQEEFNLVKASLRNYLLIKFKSFGFDYAYINKTRRIDTYSKSPNTVIL